MFVYFRLNGGYVVAKVFCSVGVFLCNCEMVAWWFLTGLVANNLFLNQIPNLSLNVNLWDLFLLFSVHLENLVNKLQD